MWTVHAPEPVVLPVIHVFVSKSCWIDPGTRNGELLQDLLQDYL